MVARRNVAPLIALAILLGIVAAMQARLGYDAILAEIHTTETARAPFQIAVPGGTIENLGPEATAAGLAPREFVQSFDGQAVGGVGQLFRVLKRHHAGDVVPITVAQDGKTISTAIKLAPASESPLTISKWALAITLDELTAWFCILLGFFVAFLRPRDRLAWLLLLLLLSFKQLSRTDVLESAAYGWGDFARDVEVFWSSLFGVLWSLAMLLFGQYFPDRKADRRWDRVIRWALGAPLVVVALVAATVQTATIDDANALYGVSVALNRLVVPITLLQMAATSTFFINIFRKMAMAQSCDDKRRLKLLYGGTTASLAPLFLIIVGSLIFRYSLSAVPAWIIAPAVIALFLFPLTLAYVIVVEKAMELRVVLRQGLQYALAKRGLRVVTFIVFTIITLSALRIATEPSVRRPYQMMVFAIALVILIRLRMQVERLRAWIDRKFFREAVDAERILTELSESVRSIVEVKPLLATVTKTISSTMHVPRVAALLCQNGDFAPAHAIGFDSAPEVRFSAHSVVAEHLARLREPERVSLNREDSWASRESEDRKQLERLETELLLPLAFKDRLLGFLSLGPKLSEEPYSPNDVQLLQSVAAQTGLALENTRLTEAVATEVAQRERLNRELEIAREVQQRLFPQSGPAIQGLDYAGRCRPASSVGGDYYDFVSMSEGRLGIAIGDISGKGVPAALLMASLQASLRGLAIANPAALSTLMENLNRLVYDASPSNRYATFFYGVYNPTTLVFEYVNGGHNPPMVFRGDEVIRLEEGGPVIGLFGPARYKQSAIQLHPGDTLVLFTDGVSEAMNNDDEEFDEPRLIEAVLSGEGLSASELIDRVMKACDDFAAGAPQHDDMTLVVARVA